MKIKLLMFLFVANLYADWETPQEDFFLLCNDASYKGDEKDIESSMPEILYYNKSSDTLTIYRYFIGKYSGHSIWEEVFKRTKSSSKMHSFIADKGKSWLLDEIETYTPQWYPSGSFNSKKYTYDIYRETLKSRYTTYGLENFKCYLSDKSKNDALLVKYRKKFDEWKTDALYEAKNKNQI